MSEKKRKRDSQGKAERPHKKVAIASPSNLDTVKVSVLQEVEEWTPLLGNLGSIGARLFETSLTATSIYAWHIASS